MKPSLTVAISWLALASTLAGCSSDPSRTHRGELLDDKVTAQRVLSELQRSGPDFRDVQVRAVNGVVVLSGAVNSEEIRSRAEQIARKIHRVKHLEDDLRVTQ